MQILIKVDVEPGGYIHRDANDKVITVATSKVKLAKSVADHVLECLDGDSKPAKAPKFKPADA